MAVQQQSNQVNLRLRKGNNGNGGARRGLGRAVDACRRAEELFQLANDSLCFEEVHDAAAGKMRAQLCGQTVAVSGDG